MADHKYRNPPIHEAICQLTFASQLPWNIRVAGSLYEKVKDRYSNEPVEQQLVQADLIGVPSVGENVPPIRVVQSPARIQFKSGDETQMLTVGPDLMAVHRLAPYIGFEEEFLPRVEQDIQTIAPDFDAARPFRSVSLRYINKIVVPGHTIDLNEYFSYGGFAAIDSLPFRGGVSGFIYRTQLENPDEKTRFSLTIASVDSPEETVGVLLDLDLASFQSEGFDAASAANTLTLLKSQENSLFESLITAKCRELFV